MFAAGEGLDPLLFQQSRGWSSDEWTAATERLLERGLVDPRDSLTPEGAKLREQIERDTDELAIAPYASLGGQDISRLLTALGPAADRIAASGELAFPNPMGLPDPRPH